MTRVTVKLDNTAPIKPPTTPAQVVEGDFCACDFRCQFNELVFADNSPDATGITNDYTDFLFRKVSPSDTITYKLYRYGVEVAEIVDDTYGTFYDGFTTQPLYIGWLADWTLIFNAFGGGQYQVKVTTNILSVETTFESRYFRLYLWDAELANRTVKIESYQNGNIESSEFDYTDLIDGGWYSSIRLRGIFGQMNATIERDIYQDSSYRTIQNRDNVIREYTLQCEIIPETIYDRIATSDMLGNEIYITSYDLLQEQKYQKFPVVPESYNDAIYNNNGGLNFSITMGDRQKNIIKRNF